jgi:3-oxo-5-alpha-steroid 4-dehydrogenase 1
MDELGFFNDLLAVWIVLAGMTFVTLFFVAAPYGRHARRGWGPTVSNRTGWVIMEGPAAVVFGACFLLGEETGTATARVLAGLWEIHYVHRAFIYPLGLRGRDRRMPLTVVGTAFLFNSVNGYLNGRYLFTFSRGYADAWLGDPRFLVGFVLFVIGFLVNRQADHVLRQLRLTREDAYGIPRGGLYRWISCPNYFGEIVEWLGWAVATWSWVGLSFTLWTVANLAPRAWSHHRWYRESFADYPDERRALVPRLW